MERKNNIRKPKGFTAIIRLVIVLFLMSLLIGVKLINEIKQEDEKEYIVALITFIVVTIIIVMIMFIGINSFFKSIYKMNYLNNQISFYTYNYVFITQKKECVKITTKKNRVIFEFSNGVKLYALTRILVFIKFKRIQLSEINKQNFPNAVFVSNIK